MQPTRPRILFVDDHDDTRFMVETWLAHYDYEVATADGMASGLRRAERELFDLYIFDTNLSDGTGAELCGKIRKFDSVTPIIFFSGDAVTPAQCEVALECGAQAYVLKPELDHLRQSIFHFMNTAVQT